MDEDPFDSLLGLEDQFYEEGYKLGVADGTQAGHIEGRLFGLEKGFEKFLEMGKLHGRSVVWASRLPGTDNKGQDHIKSHPETHTAQAESQPVDNLSGQASLSPLPDSVRLEKHLRTFHALVELESLSTQNKEECVSDFDDRLKRAMGKAKIIEKIIGEGFDLTIATASRDGETDAAIRLPFGRTGDGSIEDISVLHARH